MIALTDKTDPSGTVTAYSYDTNGDATSAIYDPTGVHQQTVYKYDTNNRLSEVDKPDGSVITFSYDADGNRTSKALTASGTTTTINDVYQNGRVAYQTDGSGTLLATFTYDDNGVPTSVTVGSNPQTAPRYYYVYNGHGDVVNLADASGNIVASYSYDEFGIPLSSSESLPGGWTNPYRYDGRDDVRYDGETGLYWMSVRAYDPTLGRFIARDPLGRVPLMGWTSQPYAYAGNNPLVNVDCGGQVRHIQLAAVLSDRACYPLPARCALAPVPQPQVLLLGLCRFPRGRARARRNLAGTPLLWLPFPFRGEGEGGMRTALRSARSVADRHVVVVLGCRRVAIGDSR